MLRWHERRIERRAGASSLFHLQRCVRGLLHGEGLHCLRFVRTSHTTSIENMPIYVDSQHLPFSKNRDCPIFNQNGINGTTTQLKYGYYVNSASHGTGCVFTFLIVICFLYIYFFLLYRYTPSTACPVCTGNCAYPSTGILPASISTTCPSQSPTPCMEFVFLFLCWCICLFASLFDFLAVVCAFMICTWWLVA